MMLKLTEEVRAFAKKPFGLLYRGEGANVVKRALRGDEFLVCVGDIVSLTTLKAGFKPKIIVFDGKTVRKELNSIDEIRELSRGYEEVIAVNPAGCITEDLTEKVFVAVNSALEGSNVRIYVKGEEDLAVMPLVALLPNGSVILYGQPNEGVVRVDVNDERKVIILSMLERMEKHGKTLEKIRRWLNGGSR
jgi:uncharacterized protein (UPF0218 family)